MPNTNRPAPRETFTERVERLSAFLSCVDHRRPFVAEIKDPEKAQDRVDAWYGEVFGVGSAGAYMGTETVLALCVLLADRETLVAAFNAAGDAVCPVTLDAVAMVMTPGERLVAAIETIKRQRDVAQSALTAAEQRGDEYRREWEAASERDRAANYLREQAERERDELRQTVREWRTDLGPIAARARDHRDADAMDPDAPYRIVDTDDVTIPLGLHDGDKGGEA